MRNVQKRSGRGGFSLLEVAVATILIAVGLTALLVAVGANTRVNDAGRKLTDATFLTQEVREWTLSLPFSDPDPWDANSPPGPDGTDPQVFVDDLDDLMNVTYAPPRDGQGNVIAHMIAWGQTITLTWRDPNNLTQSVADGTSDIIHVNVDVTHAGETVLSADWLVARRRQE